MIPSVRLFGVLWTAMAAVISYHAARILFPSLPAPAFLNPSVEAVAPPTAEPGDPLHE